MTAKCPKCDHLLTSIRSSVKATSADFNSVPINAVVFSCPSCQSCLGVSPDPFAVAADAAKRTVVLLKKAR